MHKIHVYTGMFTELAQRVSSLQIGPGEITSGTSRNQNQGLHLFYIWKYECWSRDPVFHVFYLTLSIELSRS